MRTVVTTYAITLAGGIVLYVIFEVSEGLDPPWRWVLLAAVFFVTAGVSVVSGRKVFDRETRRDVAVGTGIASGKDTDVEDIDVAAPAGETRVGTGILSRGNARISRIRIRGHDRDEGDPH